MPAMDWCDSTYSCIQTPDDNVGLKKFLNILSKQSPNDLTLAALASIGSCALVGTPQPGKDYSMCDGEFYVSSTIPLKRGIELAYMVKTLCSTTCQTCSSSSSTSPSSNSPSPSSSSTSPSNSPSPSSSNGGAASCVDDDVGIVAAVPLTYRSYVTNCAGLPNTVTPLGTLNLCSFEQTKDVAKQNCPVTCNACPGDRRRLTTNPPASMGNFSLSPSGCLIDNEIIVKQHTELIIRGDPHSVDHLPIIQPTAWPTGLFNNTNHRLFKVIGKLILEHVHLKGGNIPNLFSCSSEHGCFLTDRAGSQVYVGDTVGGLLTSNIAMMKATDVLFTEGGSSNPLGGKKCNFCFAYQNLFDTSI